MPISMHCPCDNSLLNQGSLGIENLHRCNLCSGTFIAGNVFSQIRAFSAMETHKRANGSKPFIRRSDKEALTCPKDGKPMHTLMYKNVEIDVCSICHGVWLDSGEFEKINSLVNIAKPVNLTKISEEMPWIKNRLSVADGFEGVKLVADLTRFIASICD